MTRNPHPYGPHQPEAAPNAVTVLSPAVHSCGRLPHRDGCTITSWPVPRVMPIPAALVRQREQLNTRAHEAGR